MMKKTKTKMNLKIIRKTHMIHEKMTRMDITNFH